MAALFQCWRQFVPAFRSITPVSMAHYSTGAVQKLIGLLRAVCEYDIVNWIRGASHLSVAGFTYLAHSFGGQKRGHGRVATAILVSVIERAT
jgi:hypothetical protein